MKLPTTLTLTLSLLTTLVRADFCGQWATTTKGPYIIYNNLWGKSNADSGQQCTGVDSFDGTTLAWHTAWTWKGGPYSVKSFANAAYMFDPITLDSVKRVPTRWEWRYVFFLSSF